jgi:hypothetical protein
MSDTPREDVSQALERIMEMLTSAAIPKAPTITLPEVEAQKLGAWLNQVNDHLREIEKVAQGALLAVRLVSAGEREPGAPIEQPATEFLRGWRSGDSATAVREFAAVVMARRARVGERDERALRDLAERERNELARLDNLVRSRGSWVGYEIDYSNLATRMLAALAARPSGGATPRNMTEQELARITDAVYQVAPAASLFDNVPSDMTWGQLVQEIADLLGGESPASPPEPEP